MIAAANFDADHAFTERARRLIERDLYAKYAYQGRYVSLVGEGGVVFLQRVAHIDTVLQAGPDRAVTIEEKIVRRKHTAFAIETHSNLEHSLEAGRPDGWIHTSSADKLLYAFAVPGGLEVWLMPLGDLRKWFVPREANYPLSDTGNGWAGRIVYHTRCRIVPIGDVGCEKKRYELKW